LINELKIELYDSQPAACRAHDSRAADVAQIVANAIEAGIRGVVVEHVGSTSVPGCAGKGVVDLMVVYPDGHLDVVRELIDRLGFQRQSSRDPWPEERPMRIGSVVYEGTRFLLHVHVIAASSPEVSVLRTFRDRLRSDPELVAAYVACKKGIIAGGCTDSVDYCIRKGSFITDTLGD
jgi:GrpB-like predicted nucleotidyltransferase (UPF0157 family)